jgi:hypothetical protein
VRASGGAVPPAAADFKRLAPARVDLPEELPVTLRRFAQRPRRRLAEQGFRHLPVDPAGRQRLRAPGQRVRRAGGELAGRERGQRVPGSEHRVEGLRSLEEIGLPPADDHRVQVVGTEEGVDSSVGGFSTSRTATR